MPHDTVTVHYRGTFAVSGQTFDSSYDRNEPFTASLDRFVKGWQEGIPGMKVGSRRRLIVPPELGYGSKDVKMGNVVIPANSMLVFDLEVLATKR
jgi:FKBP-type peptidyl-prolyl cis-trans isomerase